MGFFDLFRRRPPVDDAASLAAFIDEQAAFLAQKGIFEYCRARAGRYSETLFKEQAFRQQLEAARWRAFPLGLAMVAEAVDSVLRPHTGQDRHAVHDGLVACVLSVFDRYPAPFGLQEAEWQAARNTLVGRLDELGIRAPKLMKDAAIPYAQDYFALMPIHEKLRQLDFPSVRNYLRLTLCNVHDELSRRIDAGAVVETLRRDRADRMP